MELTQLKYFLEVAKNQHVTKSAEKLHVAQPALTQAIHRLEEELGVKLFVPKGRGIMLSSYGEYFFAKLSPLMEGLNRLPDELHTMADLEDATIHLNVLAASTLVTEAIIEYQRIDDSIHIQLKQNEQSDLYDICVTTRLFYQPPEKQREEERQFVCTEKIYLAVPNIARFQGIKSLSLKDVKEESFISLLGSKQLRTICDKYCSTAGIVPNIVFESDSPAAVRNMIAANMGVGFWPEFSWGRLNTDKVLLLDIANPICSRDILVTYKKNKRDSARAEAFFEYLSGYLKRASAGEN